MQQVEVKKAKGKKLVKVKGFTRHGIRHAKSTRLIRIAEPHIRHHKVNGKLFYYYCRGIDPEEYLGTADFIRDAVYAMRDSINKGLKPLRF